MNTAEFRARFPEFDNVDDCLIERHVADAVAELDQGHLGKLYDACVCYLAAHRLTLSPLGQAARLAPKDGVTTYLTHYRDLVRKRARVVAI